MKATRLTIEGVGPDEVTTGFLTSIVAAAEAEELAVTGVSIDWRAADSDEDDDAR